MKLLTIYLILMNAAGLMFMLVDKQKAIHNRWRIPEATLMTVAAIGGSLGCLLGMKLFRHKTKHNSFKFGFPVILILQLVVIGLIAYQFTA